MSSIYITSDTHFRHANIIKFCKRAPFYDPNDFDENGQWKTKNLKYTKSDTMTSVGISNWNSVVKPDDIVYHLGDLCWGKTDQVLDILRRLNGEIRFIWGNHDDNLKQVAGIIDLYSDLRNRIKFLGDYAKINVEGQIIILSHYAMRVWDQSHRGAWMLYGHSHGSLDDDKNALSFDVGYDCHNLFPISFERIKEIMAKKDYKPVDHHGADSTVT
jgi:calcineurin-like phosphoesterase family protein